MTMYRSRNAIREARSQQERGVSKCQEVEQRDPQGGVEDVAGIGVDGDVVDDES